MSDVSLELFTLLLFIDHLFIEYILSRSFVYILCTSQKCDYMLYATEMLALISYGLSLIFPYDNCLTK